MTQDTARALARKWLNAHNATRNLSKPAAAEAETHILIALNQARRAGLTLLIDDLTAALTHVDGCNKSHQKRCGEQFDEMYKAQAALIDAGFDVTRPDGCEALNDLTQDAELEHFLLGRADSLRDYAT